MRGITRIRPLTVYVDTVPGFVQRRVHALLAEIEKVSAPVAHAYMMTVWRDATVVCAQVTMLALYVATVVVPIWKARGVPTGSVPMPVAVNTAATLIVVAILATGNDAPPTPRT